MDRAGVYLHIPFCRSRCSYCDFATGMYESDFAERYVRALRKEIGLWNEMASPCVVDTIYFGGGTPSLLSIDQIERILIAGLPGQTIDGWKRNLEQALKLRPEHLSLYLLDVHEGTPLHDQINRGVRPKPDDDLAAEMYAFMIDEIGGAGYEHYEISNFCLPGFASRHNSKYWSGAPYYGFGNSAHSYDGARRRWTNQRDTTKYVDLIDRGASPIVERTELSDEDAQSEAIFLGLRLMKGINLQNYRARFGGDLRAEFNGELDRLSDAGLIEVDADVLKLTSRGALLSNEVFAALA